MSVHLSYLPARPKHKLGLKIITDEDNFVVDSIWFTSLLMIPISISPSSARALFAGNGCF